MAVERMKRFLDERGIPYTTVQHRRALTAADTAVAAGVLPRGMAKAVVVMIDHRLAMAVVPTDTAVNLERLAKAAGAAWACLAREAEFMLCFPDCQAGAMPALGNLWGMDVYADEALAGNERIAFNAGTHDELLEMSWEDFLRLARPRVGSFAEPVPARWSRGGTADGGVTHDAGGAERGQA
jgi:Ala-tRNA(Pro) deacylase